MKKITHRIEFTQPEIIWLISALECKIAEREKEIEEMIKCDYENATITKLIKLNLENLKTLKEKIEKPF